MRTKEDARALIDAVKKVPLGFYPTPFHKLERMSELTGVNLWVKREDFSGVSLFGGNKVRKLEFLLADAVRKGCDTVFTYGATESNHAMQTATAARKLGLKPVLWLGAIVEPNPAALRANMLLDRILGAEIHILESRGSTRETMEANQELFEKRKNELEKGRMSSRKKGTGYMTFRWAAPFLGARSGLPSAGLNLPNKQRRRGFIRIMCTPVQEAAEPSRGLPPDVP